MWYTVTILVKGEKDTDMTRRERVKAALAHQTADKVPSCIHLAGDGWKKYDDKLYEKYVSGELKELCEQGKISRRHAICYGMGNHVLTVNCPWWKWYDVPKEYYTDYDAPEYLPKTVGTGSYEEFIGTVKNLREYTDAYILVTIWGSHFEKANFARGIENFLADMAGEPEYAQKMLDYIIHKNIVMLENIIHTPGLDGILLGSDWGAQKDLMMAPETWRKMIAPGEKKEYELIHSAGLDVWVHSCGDIRKIFSDIVELGG